MQTHELVVPGYNSSLQSYLQWRPVVYTTMARDLSSSTEVNVGRDEEVLHPDRELNGTILYAMYGANLQNMIVRRFNVTLGGKGDGFYKKTGYQAW